jgi:hypothetical protein
MTTRSLAADILNNNIFRFAFAIVGLLSIPLIAMQFTDEVNWTLGDFIVMGVLLFGVSLIYELLVKRVRDKDHRYYVTIVLILGFVWLWAELAVGLFTNWGS